MITALYKVVDKITDGSHNPPQGVSTSPYLMLSSKNIDDDSISLESPRYLSKESFEVENRRTHIAEGDILLTIVGSIGRAAIVSKNLNKICLQRSVAVIKPKRDILVPKYLMYQFHYLQPVLEKEAHGVAQKGIYIKQIEKLYVKIVDIEEQYNIVKVLDKISFLISLRKRQLAKFNELVKARFVEMFGDLTNNKSWKFSPLKLLCDVRDGTHDSPNYVFTGYPLLTSKNFSDGKIDFSTAKLISPEDFNKINQRSKVDYGDIVMPMIGTIGNPVIVNTDKEFAIKNVALIKFKDKTISNIFIKYVLLSDYFLNIINNLNKGGTQKFLSLSDIRNIPIPIIPISLQNEFSDFVKELDIIKNRVQQSLEKLETLKASLMQEYFG